MTRNVLLSVLFGGLFLTAVFASAQRPASKQLVAHRGASAYAPEHTLEAYRLALEQKADFVEQDLAVTKDGVLVCLHDLTLERTTNVEEVFPDRFVEDKKGTAAVQTLARARFHARRDQAARRRLVVQPEVRRGADPDVPGSDRSGARQGRALPRTEGSRRSTAARGVRPEVLFAGVLEKNRLVGDARTPVIIQSFDETTLRALVGTAARGPAGVPRRSAWRRAPRFRSQGPRHRRPGPPASGRTSRLSQQHPELVTLGARSRADGHALYVPVGQHRRLPIGARGDGEVPLRYGVDALFTDNPDQFPRR